MSQHQEANYSSNTAFLQMVFRLEVLGDEPHTTREIPQGLQCLGNSRASQTQTVRLTSRPCFFYTTGLANGGPVVKQILHLSMQVLLIHLQANNVLLVLRFHQFQRRL